METFETAGGFRSIALPVTSKHSSLGSATEKVAPEMPLALA